MQCCGVYLPPDVIRATLPDVYNAALAIAREQINSAAGHSKLIKLLNHIKNFPELMTDFDEFYKSIDFGSVTCDNMLCQRLLNHRVDLFAHLNELGYQILLDEWKRIIFNHSVGIDHGYSDEFVMEMMPKIIPLLSSIGAEAITCTIQENCPKMVYALVTSGMAYHTGMLEEYAYASGNEKLREYLKLPVRPTLWSRVTSLMSQWTNDETLPV